MFVGRERVGGHVRRGSQLARRQTGSLSSWKNQPSHTFIQVQILRLDAIVVGRLEFLTRKAVSRGRNSFTFTFVTMGCFAS